MRDPVTCTASSWRCPPSACAVGGGGGGSCVWIDTGAGDDASADAASTARETVITPFAVLRCTNPVPSSNLSSAWSTVYLPDNAGAVRPRTNVVGTISCTSACCATRFNESARGCLPTEKLCAFPCCAAAAVAAPPHAMPIDSASACASNVGRSFRRRLDEKQPFFAGFPLIACPFVDSILQSRCHRPCHVRLHPPLCRRTPPGSPHLFFGAPVRICRQPALGIPSGHAMQSGLSPRGHASAHRQQRKRHR